MRKWSKVLPSGKHVKILLEFQERKEGFSGCSNLFDFLFNIKTGSSYVRSATELSLGALSESGLGKIVFFRIERSYLISKTGYVQQLSKINNKHLNSKNFVVCGNNIYPWLTIYVYIGTYSEIPICSHFS